MASNHTMTISKRKNLPNILLKYGIENPKVVLKRVIGGKTPLVNISIMKKIKRSVF